MVMQKKYSWTLDLQQFAETVDENGLIDFGEDDDDDGDFDFDFGNLGNDPEDESESSEGDSESEELVPEQEQSQEEPQKPEQSAEENAKFAEQRRQKQAEERAQQMLKESTEYKLAQTLADMYGVDVPTMLQQIEHAKLEQQAKQQGKTVEQLKADNAEKQRVANLETELWQLKFKDWERSKDVEISGLKDKYKMISDDEFAEAKSYLLGTMKDPNAPVERAVFALYGEKIFAAHAESQRQEALAEVSGRKKGPLAPQGRAPSANETLTDRQKYFAKQMGISEADYLKYK